ncbi:MAG: DUF2177 family protein [Reyranella sp.]|nr:DUF2177 family protein [Reyranella sp.]
MRSTAITYLAVLAVFTVIDIVWLSMVAINFYKREIGSLLLDKPRLDAAFLFYALYAGGLMILVVQPALDSGSWHKALLLGAVFGLCAYGTYDLTNLATLQRWPLRLAIVDMAWGTLLTTTTALAGFFVGRLAFAGTG